MISIIIPLYNKGKLIERSINSVLSQDYRDFEILVIDDGSTDNSASFVAAFSDPRVRYIYKENGGVSSARNRGMLEANGEWIYFLDADDEMHPGALAIYHQLIQKYPNHQLFTTNQDSRYSSNGKLLRMRLRLGNTLHSSSNSILGFWLRLYSFCPGTMLFKKDLIKETGLFDERKTFFEDLDFSLRLMKNRSIGWTDFKSFVYYQSNEGLSSTTHAIEREMAYYIPEIIEKNHPGIWHKAVLYDNLELQILYWQQVGIEKNVKYYREVQKKYFSVIYRWLHWIHQQLVRHGLI